MKKGKEHLHIPPAEVECMLSQAVLVPSETDMNESSLPAFPPGHVLDHPSPRFGDSSTPHPTSDPLVNTEYIAETTHLDGAIFGDAVRSEDVGGTLGKEVTFFNLKFPCMSYWGLKYNSVFNCVGTPVCICLLDCTGS